MWTDDTEDEIMPASTEHLEQIHQPSTAEHLLFGKTTILILTLVAVLLSGILPFLAVRAFLTDKQRSDFKPSPKIDYVDDVNARTISDILAGIPSSRSRKPAGHHASKPHKSPVKRSRLPVIPANTPEKLMHQEMEHPNSCSSVRCKREAKNISDQLDDSTDPCTDFYQYVCGKWERTISPPPGSPKVSVDTLTQDRLTRLVDVSFRRYVEDLERVADLYNECRYHKTGDVEKPLFDYIVHQLGNSSWFMSIRNMIKGLKKSLWPPFADIADPMFSRSIGIFYRVVNEPALFSIRPATDNDFPNETLVSIGFPKLVLGPFVSDSGNYSFMTSAMNVIFEESNLTEGVNVDVLNIERLLALAIHSSPPEQPRLVQIGDLPNAGKLKWSIFFKALMAEDDMDFNHIYVIVESVHYLEALEEVLQDLEDFEILAYLGFRAKLVVAPLLPKDRHLDFLAALAVARFPEWHPPLREEHYCVRFFDKFEPIMSLYAARDIITSVLGQLDTTPLVEALKRVFLDELSVMFSANFRNYLLEGISETTWTALMPDWITRERSRKTYLDFFYTHQIRDAMFLQFAHLIQRKNSNAFARYLRGSFFDAAWEAGLLSTTASASRERVDIPPAAFDFFRADPKEPALHPYQLARLAPRVFTSVFGLVFDEALNYFYHDGHHAPWRQLSEVRSCLLDQYTNQARLRYPNISAVSMASGWSLLAEALAVAPAFKTFLSILNREVPLEGLEGWSSQKLFFVYYALNYCESNNPDFLSRIVEYGTEVPASDKVNGALRNSIIFTSVFDCKKGTYMNPGRRCTLLP